MLEIELGKYRRARLWINDIPESCRIPSSELAANLVSKERDMDMATRGIALELYIPLGGRLVYGLLGAEFIKNDSDSLSVDLYPSISRFKKYNDALCGAIDDAYVGLPEFCTKVVRTETQKYLENCTNKPSGKLIYNCSAYSEVGTNQDVFQKLTIIVCRFLFSDCNFLDEEDFRGLILSVL
jgi:hypothetical protein